MSHCMVLFCTTRGTFPGISYFKLTPARHGSWLRALGRNPELEQLSEANKVCSLHFEEKDLILKKNKITLKGGAIPKIKLGPRKPDLEKHRTQNRLNSIKKVNESTSLDNFTAVKDIHLIPDKGVSNNGMERMEANYRRGSKAKLRLSTKRRRINNLAKYNRDRRLGLPTLNKAIITENKNGNIPIYHQEPLFMKQEPCTSTSAAQMDIAEVEIPTSQTLRISFVPDVKQEIEIANPAFELEYDIKPEIEVPQLISFSTPQEQTSNFAIDGTTPVIIKQEETCIEELIAEHVVVTSSPHERISKNYEVPIIKEEPASDNESETSTSSEAERETAKLTQEKYGQCSSGKRICRYVGDMTASDFDTPEKTNQNLAIVRKTVSNQKRKIHSLQNKVRRLKLKIASLKSKLQSISNEDLSMSEPSDSEYS